MRPSRRPAAVLAAFAALAAVGGLLPAFAEPVVAIERRGGRKETVEFVELSGGQAWIRRLNAVRGVETIPLSEMLTVDFGETPIELNARGAILLDAEKPDDVAALRWAVDRREFALLFRTCRLDTGTAGFSRVVRLNQEIADELARQDIAPDRRRDLELAHATLLACMGRNELARQEFKRLRQVYAQDPVFRQFAQEFWSLIVQEALDRLPAEPGDGPAGPRPRLNLPRGERMNEPPPPNP